MRPGAISALHFGSCHSSLALVLENLLIWLVVCTLLMVRVGALARHNFRRCDRGLNTVETLTISFIVFTFGSLLVAIQVASGQSRLALLLRRCCTTTSSASRSGYLRSQCYCGWQVREWTRKYPTRRRFDSVGAGIASIAAFQFLIDYTARLLRRIKYCPVDRRTGDHGERVRSPRVGGACALE